MSSKIDFAFAGDLVGDMDVIQCQRVFGLGRNHVGIKTPQLQLLRDLVGGSPALDTAVSRALLVRAVSGEHADTLRLYRPAPAVVFGRLDKLAPGFQDAVKAGRGLGFDAVLRLVGGRAAVFDIDTIAFAHATHDPRPTFQTEARFRETADLMKSALQKIGVDARVGEVPGEYCPGAYSINAGGRRKLVGIGQRVVAGAAHVGGVIVVGGAQRVRSVLEPVYAALGLDWDRSTVGAVEDEIAVTSEEVERAILNEYRELYELREATIDQETLELAQRFEPDHRV